MKQQVGYKRIGFMARWVLGLVTVFVLLGCETEPPMPEGRIRVIDPGPLGDEATRPTGPGVRWLVRQVALRLDEPVEKLWSASDETILSEVNRAVWNGNGLRAGLLPSSAAETIYEVLGEAREARDFQIRNFGDPELLRRSPPLRADFFADLTVPPLPENIEYFTRGRLQLLMTSRPRGDGSALITLLPQHHVPKSTFVARTAAEKLLDGRLYDELGVELNIGTNEVLLLGFYQTAPPSREDELSKPDVSVSPETPEESSRDETAEPATTDETESNPPEPTPPPVQTEIESATPEAELNLGRGLFTTGVRDRDLQFFLLLRPLP